MTAMSGNYRWPDAATAVGLAIVALAACRCGASPNVPTATPVPALLGGTPGPAVRAAGDTGGRPVILYSDLASAPRGAFVTFWGHELGDDPGAGRILLGELPITRVLGWSSSRIEVRLPEEARSGSVVVQTPRGPSAPFPLRIHDGSLWFVSTTGNDGASGSEAQPFATIRRGLAALRPGDVLYIRGGTYVPPPDPDFRAHIRLGEIPTGTAERPIAIAGYPGETVVIGDGSTQKIFAFDHDRPFEYITIAKLKLLPACLGMETLESRHVRIVANEITGSRSECADGTIAVGGGFDIRILGNDLHDNGGPKLKSCVYLSGFGDSHDIEVAYNRMSQHGGGRAIQMYGHLPEDSISNVQIHSNEISEIDRDAILVGNTDGGNMPIHDILIANNVVIRSGRCVGWAVRVDNPLAEGIRIVHNTLVGNGAGDSACDRSSGEPMAQIGIERARSVSIENNILVSAGRAGLVQLLDPRAAVHCSHNLYSGRGTPCPREDRPILGAPAFVDPGARNYGLAPGSPAIDGAAQSIVGVDAVGALRPAGSAPDVGALERAP
ncbi:MAG: hypothetical protein HYY06_05540 [Deltaproteobacteria bacterium]|nr:hypothetical protein [Deltaproteobacteria bacterium]